MRLKTLFQGLGCGGRYIARLSEGVCRTFYKGFAESVEFQTWLR